MKMTNKGELLNEMLVLATNAHEEQQKQLRDLVKPTDT
jgi:hypothetical protein